MVIVDMRVNRRMIVRWLPFFVSIFLILSGQSVASEYDKSTVRNTIGVQIKLQNATRMDLEAIYESGFGVVRIDMNWHAVEKERGIFLWSKHDRFLAMADELGLVVVVVLKGGNINYSKEVDLDPSKYWGKSKMPESPRTDSAIKGFVEFVTEASNRYRGSDIVWEIWNEPDWRFWMPKPNPREFSKLANVVCAELKRNDPDAVVIGPGLSQLPGSFLKGRSDFIVELLDTDFVSCVDGISIHPYRKDDGWPESAIGDIDEVRSYIKRKISREVSVPYLVNSEWGYSLTKIGLKKQAEYSVRSVLTGIYAGLNLGILYEWKDTHYASKTKERSFGLLTSEGSEKLAFKSMKSIISRITEMRVKERLRISDNDVYFLHFVGEAGSSLVVGWSVSEENNAKYSVRVGDQSISAYIKTMPIVIEYDSQSDMYVDVY